MDTAFLRDWRPLFRVPAFSYREGIGVGLNIAVLRIAQRPHARSRDFIAGVANGHLGGQAAYSRLLAQWDGRSHFVDMVQYLSLPLFDFVWLRFNAFNKRLSDPATREAEMLKAQIAELAGVHPEFSPALYWNAFFEPLSPLETYSRSLTPFLSGSFSYHWHNRYNVGLPPNSWAGVLNDRFGRLAALKAQCAGARRSATTTPPVAAAASSAAGKA